MTKYKGYSREQELSNEYAAAASGLAATACNNALVALQTMASDPSAANAMARIHHLNEYARRIHSNLETGEQAFDGDDVDTANLEWASALVLMDALSIKANESIEADHMTDDATVTEAVKLQKSGKTA